jgi:hypothetical protein
MGEECFPSSATPSDADMLALTVSVVVVFFLVVTGLVGYLLDRGA